MALSRRLAKAPHRLSLPLTVEEMALLERGLDALVYWELSDDLHRNDGAVIPPGSAVPDDAAEIVRVERLGDRIRALAHDLLQGRRSADIMLSLREAASRLGVAPRTMRRYIAVGKVPAYRIETTGQLRVRASDIETLLVPREPLGIDPELDTHVSAID